MLVAVAKGVSVGKGVFVVAVVGMAVGGAGGGAVGRGVNVFTGVGIVVETAVSVGGIGVSTLAISSSTVD